MTKSFYIILTMVAAFFVFYLQGHWIGRSYKLLEGQLAQQIHESYFEATQQCQMDTTNNLFAFFKKELQKRDLDKLHFRLDTVSISSGDFQKFDKQIYQTDYYPLFKEQKTFIFPINETQGIQAFITNPRAGSLGKMLYYSFSTVIALGILILGILKQISIIKRQNQMAQVREDFSYAMIHDMKTPLSSILMGTRILRSGKLDEKPEKKERYFDILEEEAQHLLTLTNKILTISKLEHGQLILEKQFVTLRPMLEDLIEKFTAKSAKPITFHLNLAAETIYADEEYFKEAVSNLIDNAIKYSKDFADIQISSSSYQQYIQLKVRDSGLGIPLSEQSHIFDKFERASASRRTQNGGASGFGLGLNYVMNVTKAHGGNVGLESQEGKYSEFTISLPLPNENEQHD